MKTNQNMIQKNNIISIDTGSNGGISIIKDGIVYCSPFMDIDNTKNFIISICEERLNDFICVIESLNIFSSVNGSKNTIFKQGVVFGECIGLLKGLNISSIIEVSAKKWQKVYDLPKGIDYKERKNVLMEIAEREFPNEMNFKKTKKYKGSICDSLLILKYFLESYE